MIWRHSSEPIEPPAPVTMTTLPWIHASEQPRVRRHRVAPEQVAGIDVAHVLDARVAGEDVGVVRHRLHQQVQRLDRLENLLPAAARLRRQREEHRGHAFVMHQGRQLAGREHFQPVDGAAVQAKRCRR